MSRGPRHQLHGYCAIRATLIRNFQASDALQSVRCGLLQLLWLYLSCLKPPWPMLHCCCYCNCCSYVYLAYTLCLFIPVTHCAASFIQSDTAGLGLSIIAPLCGLYPTAAPSLKEGLG